MQVWLKLFPDAESVYRPKDYTFYNITLTCWVFVSGSIYFFFFSTKLKRSQVHIHQFSMVDRGLSYALCCSDTSMGALLPYNWKKTLQHICMLLDLHLFFQLVSGKPAKSNCCRWEGGNRKQKNKSPRNSQCRQQSICWRRQNYSGNAAL